MEWITLFLELLFDNYSLTLIDKLLCPGWELFGSDIASPIQVGEVKEASKRENMVSPLPPPSHTPLKNHWDLRWS
jgi:hypothetical protein